MANEEQFKTLLLDGLFGDIPKEFRPVLLAGLFRGDPNQLSVIENGTEYWVHKELESLVGSKVHFVMHYQPLKFDPSKWGYGCCERQRNGATVCPMGHHESPNKMLLFQATGILSKSPWAIDDVKIPFSEMPEHEGRLVVTSDFQIPEKPDLKDLGGLVEELSAMKSFLASISKIK